MALAVDGIEMIANMQAKIDMLERRIIEQEIRINEMSVENEQLGIAKRIIINGETYYITSDAEAVLRKVRGGNTMIDDDGLTIGEGVVINSDKEATFSLAFITAIKTGATQAAAGAVATEIWATNGHASLPDNVLLIGV